MVTDEIFGQSGVLSWFELDILDRGRIVAGRWPQIVQCVDVMRWMQL